jgi:molybdopterin converting factor small subunit
MPRVVFTPNLRRHVDCPPADVEAADLRAALDAVFDANPRLRGYILDERGRLRRHITVFIGDRQIGDRDTLTDTLDPADEVYVMQALSGG